MPPSDWAAVLRYIDTVVPREELESRLAAGAALRVKLGLDPTAPAVTLGWAVVLRKLRQFQELGHTAVLIVGDFTAQVGDPSLRSETRRRLSADEVRGHAEAVLAQFDKVLLPEPLEVRYNSEWLGSLDMHELLELTSTATVAQMLERGDFAQRFEEGAPISVMEFLYPLMQGYDSVAVEADVELGGSDQLWNLMMARTVQQRYGQTPQVAVTVPLLRGTDGVQKMSQSLGNYIGVGDPPDDMFGRVMSIPDTLLGEWLRLAADFDPEEVAAVEAGLDDGSAHPADVKRRLGHRVVELYHGAGAAESAEEAFDRVFRRRQQPESMPEHSLGPDDPVYLPDLLRSVGLAASGSEARRLLAQGAVRVGGERVATEQVDRQRLVGAVVQVGKRRFARFVG